SRIGRIAPQDRRVNPRRGPVLGTRLRRGEPVSSLFRMGGGYMRKLLLPLAALATGPAPAQGAEIAPGIELPAGATIEVRADGDLNGDGIPDIAYVAHSEDWRALTVLLSVGNAADPRYRPEILPLEPGESTPAKLALADNVLS